MSTEPKGSTPGPIEHHHHHNLTRVNTFPSVEFTIPPSDPPLEKVVSKCGPRQTRCDDAPAPEKYPRSEEHTGDARDEENRSVTSNNDGDDGDDQVTYPEGGLQAWLVVLGSFFGAFVGFGMM